MMIRKARMMDKEDVYEMVCRMQETNLHKEQFDQVFWENMNHPSIYYIVAIENDSVIGFASLHVQSLLHHLGMIGQIQEFCINEKYRSQEIGYAMFDNLKKRAIDLGCVQLVVSKQRKYKDATTYFEAYETQQDQDTCVLKL